MSPEFGARHGTPSGWRAHQRRGEDPCDACFRARQEYDARLRAQPARVVQDRLRSRAQSRALKRLARRYPALYRELYAEEKRLAFEEAGLAPAEPGSRA